MYLGGYIAQDVFNAVFTYYGVCANAGGGVNGIEPVGQMMAIFQFLAVIGMIPLCIRLGLRRLTAWWWCCLARASLSLRRAVLCRC